MITVQTFAIGWTTAEDIEIVHLVTAALKGATRPVTAEVGGSPRSIQILEIAVDAIDIPAVRPFWKAVFGYAAEGANDGPTDPLVDPWGQGPAIWFQQMDAPRPQRNRIHFDISVPHDEALRRMDSGDPGRRPPRLRRRGSGVLGAGRSGGQRSLHHDLAGPGLALGEPPGRARAAASRAALACSWASSRSAANSASPRTVPEHDEFEHARRLDPGDHVIHFDSRQREGGIRVRVEGRKHLGDLQRGQRR